MGTSVAVSAIVVTILLSLFPQGQNFMEGVTRGKIKPAAMPWIALGFTFIWTYFVFNNPHTRGYAFGVLILGLAAALSFWAPRNDDVKNYIKIAFFGGRDVWDLPDFKMYAGVLWGAGIALVLPMGGAIVNFLGIAAAVVWIAMQAYKGNAEVSEDADEGGPEATSEAS